MKKYVLTFTTAIKGQVTVEAADAADAERQGEEMARSTLNYAELEDSGRHAPSVETEFDDIYEVDA